VYQYKLRAKNSILQELLSNPDAEEIKTLSNEDIRQLNLDADIYQVVIYENFNRKIADLAYNFADLLKITNKGNQTFEYIKIAALDVILLKGEFALKKFQDFLYHYEKNSPQKGSPLDTLFLAYGQPVHKLTDICLSYNDASSLINRRFFCLQGQHTLGYEELPSMHVKVKALTNESIQEYTSQLTDHLQTFNRKKVAETLFSLNEYLYNVNDSISAIKLFLVDLYLQIKEKLNHIYSTVDIPFPTNSAIIDLIEKKYYLYEIIRFFSEQFEMIMNATGNSSRDSIIDDIIYYIDHNYQNNIKLESIAPLFGYNSAYLGKIFSKIVGINFNSYVDYIRINHSKDLLIQNKLKVYEISEVIGYKNVDYFHKKFKKYVGISPAEFRKNAEQ
jgi:two-component system response regulator YesN